MSPQSTASPSVMTRARSWARETRRRMTGRVVVLMYHRVAEPECDPWELCVRPSRFDDQLAMVKRRAQVLSASEFNESFCRRKLPRPGVLITFDDGYADNFLVAQPLLQKHQLPAILFLCTGAIDSSLEFWWDELERVFLGAHKLPEKLCLSLGDRTITWPPEKEEDYPQHQWLTERHWRALTPPRTGRQRIYYEVWSALRLLAASDQQKVLANLASQTGQSRVARPSHRTLTTQEAEQLLAGGTFELGAHTVTHPALSARSRADQAQEIRASKVDIESRTGRSVRLLAYPYGDYAPETVAVARELGFDAAFTTEPGTVYRDTPAHELPRIQVGDWTGDELSRRLDEFI